MFITIQGKRFDARQVKRLVGSAVSFCSDEELKELTGCEPGCAAPFGHKTEIGLVIDDEVFRHERFIFSPGPPGKTIEMAVRDIEKVLKVCPNRIYRYGDASA